mgnify:CR=1 FL=1
MDVTDKPENQEIVIKPSKNMQTFTLVTITASNIFSIIPIRELYCQKRYYGMCLTTCASIASVFMHMTETKHNLKGLCLAKYSKIFLNIDRFLAYLTGFYGLYLFYNNPTKTVSQVIVPLIGGCCAAIGERTENLPLYTTLHTTWHFCAYYGLKLASFFL